MALRVLVACEESQEVTKAFRALGHEAYSCDLQECSGGHPEWHMHGDAKIGGKSMVSLEETRSIAKARIIDLQEAIEKLEDYGK